VVRRELVPNRGRSVLSGSSQYVHDLTTPSIAVHRAKFPELEVHRSRACYMVHYRLAIDDTSYISSPPN